MSNTVWRISLIASRDPDDYYEYIFSSKEKAMEYAGKCFTNDDGDEYCFLSKPYETLLDPTFPYKKFY